MQKNGGEAGLLSDSGLRPSLVRHPAEKKHEMGPPSRQSQVFASLRLAQLRSTVFRVQPSSASRTYIDSRDDTILQGSSGNEKQTLALE